MLVQKRNEDRHLICEHRLQGTLDKVPQNWSKEFGKIICMKGPCCICLLLVLKCVSNRETLSPAVLCIQRLEVCIT